MIIQLIIGALVMGVGAWMVNYTDKQKIFLAWWQWVLTFLGLIYALFVLEIIVGFLDEGALQAALVMGLLTGIVAVIWGVLLRRFVFKKV